MSYRCGDVPILYIAHGFEEWATQLHRHSENQNRRVDGRICSAGNAVVELAICLPIMFMILFATIEACVMLQLKQNLAVTAYEGARIGIIPGSSAALVQTQCEMLLNDRNIESFNIYSRSRAGDDVAW